MKFSVPAIAETIAELPHGCCVIDCGCFGWRLADACTAHDQRLIGLDRVEPPGRPANAEFARMEGPLLAPGCRRAVALPYSRTTQPDEGKQLESVTLPSWHGMHGSRRSGIQAHRLPVSWAVEFAQCWWRGNRWLTWKS